MVILVVSIHVVAEVVTCRLGEAVLDIFVDIARKKIQAREIKISSLSFWQQFGSETTLLAKPHDVKYVRFPIGICLWMSIS